MTVYLRPDLDDLPAYVPGKTFPGALKLASNEVVDPPLPSVQQAIAAAAATANRYPDNAMVELTEHLGKHLGVPPEHVKTGCGSVTLCQNLISVTSGPGDEVLFAWRSFECYPISTRIVGATPVMVSLRDHTHDLEAMADAITERTRVIFVCNPNNPTGTIVSAAELIDFLDRVPSRVLVALDEAYIEYVRPDDAQRYNAIELLGKYPNLVVLRTFSKAYGLAGLRVGYAVGDPLIIEALTKVHVPFSVNSVAQAAAIASLAAGDELRARTDQVALERARVTGELRSAGYRVPDSQANFIWLDLGAAAVPFAQASTNAGIIVRPFDGDGVRVTVTNADENDRFLGFAREWQAAQ